MRVFYLVAPSIEGGVKDARAMGWTQTARTRFVTQDNDDVRLITRFNELQPFPGMTPMMKSGCYDDPGFVEAHKRELWAEDKRRFEEFVATGAGRWGQWTGSELVVDWGASPTTAQSPI